MKFFDLGEFRRGFVEDFVSNQINVVVEFSGDYVTIERFSSIDADISCDVTSGFDMMEYFNFFPANFKFLLRPNKLTAIFSLKSFLNRFCIVFGFEKDLINCA